jgi:hypothetical protein
MRFFWVCVLLTLGQAQAMAADVVFQSLASVTNDRDAHLQKLGVLLNAGKVVGLRFDTVSGTIPHARDFSIDEVKSGAVLDSRHNAIVLQGSIDPNMGSADLIITYLSNVVFGRHKECHASMVRDESGRWHIVNVYNHKWVSQLVVKTRTFGVSTIEGICPR